MTLFPGATSPCQNTGEVGPTKSSRRKDGTIHATGCRRGGCEGSGCYVRRDGGVMVRQRCHFSHRQRRRVHCARSRTSTRASTSRCFASALTDVAVVGPTASTAAVRQLGHARNTPHCPLERGAGVVARRQQVCVSGAWRQRPNLTGVVEYLRLDERVRALRILQQVYLRCGRRTWRQAPG